MPVVRHEADGVEQLLDGETLADRLECGGPLDAKLTCDISSAKATLLAEAPQP